MFAAVNKLFAHAGREYHLQAEDLGADLAAFEVRVYDGGAILWRKRVPYAELLAKKLPREEEDEAVRALMDKTLQTVQAAIVKGKLAG
ncbi:MAG TPA: hypothetical protein VMT87_07095 [Vicinamibacteria bacterium]|nr:hypothetical protein [Vicinamibacteria bacterium]